MRHSLCERILLEGCKSIDGVPVNGKDDVALAQSCLIVGTPREDDTHGGTPVARRYIGSGHSLVVHYHAVTLGVRQKPDISAEAINDDGTVVEQ